MNAAEGNADDRLPWLETADEVYEEPRDWSRPILLALLGLAVIAAAIGGYWWVKRGGSAQGGGELINAQEGPYKVKPEEPGGMQVPGVGDTVFAASEGATTNGSVDVAAMPETPVAGKAAPKATPTPVKGARSVTASIPAAVAQATMPAQKSPGASAGSAVLQLGSFPSEAGANTAWARMSKRFNYIAPLGHSIEKALVNEKTVYRLRVNAGSNGQARELCGKLKAAGEACFLAPN